MYILSWLYLSIFLSICDTYLIIIVNICDTLLIFIIMIKSSMQATQKNQENREEEKGDTS